MSKVKFHTVDQPDSDTTCFVLSCDRLEVLDETLQSFLDTRDYDTKMVIVDDSAEPGIFETLVDRYGSFCDVICFPKNRSQWWAMDFMVSYCDTEYIFYLEDDWKLLQSGYLNQSKQILQKYRNVGTVDISWRTFEWQGIDSYHKELIDDTFFYKKPWKISDYHLKWYGWIGSPNLKRREDLILLGRVEKWHNEWNIDRKFLSMGFKAVFLNGEYARHLGDECSKMAGKRPDDGTTPESYYPVELQQDRIWPKLDYMFLDDHWKYPNEVTMVTAILDIGRNDRDFETHYIKGLDSILQCRNPLVVYAEEKYHDHIIKERGTLPTIVKTITIDDIKNDDIAEIIATDEWQNQSDWMKDSVICSPYYIPLTLSKNKLLSDIAELNPFGSKRFYWVDSGMCNSFGINEHIDTFNFLRIPEDKFFMTSFPYYTDSEIHGYDINTMTKLCGAKPTYVCRATLFGGTKESVDQFNKTYYNHIALSINNNCIGTEEAIYTMVSITHPTLVNIYEMPNGDIKNFLNTIRSR